MDTFDLLEGFGPIDSSRLETLRMQATAARQGMTDREIARLGNAVPRSSGAVPRWHIFLRPYTPAGLAHALSRAPAAARLDGRLLRGISTARQAGDLGFSGASGAPSFGSDPMGAAGGSSSDQLGSGFGFPDPSTFMGVDPSTLPSFGDQPAQLDPNGLLGGLGGILGQLGEPFGIDPGFGLGRFGTEPGQPGAGPAVTPGTMDQGVMLQAQIDLAAWAKQFPSVCTPSDFGASTSDLAGVATGRFTSALGSYQGWANANRGEQLPTDGQLDPATYASLQRWMADLAAGNPSATSSTSSTSTATYAVVGFGALAAAWYLLKKGRK